MERTFWLWSDGRDAREPRAQHPGFRVRRAPIRNEFGASVQQTIEYAFVPFLVSAAAAAGLTSRDAKSMLRWTSKMVLKHTVRFMQGTGIYGGERAEFTHTALFDVPTKGDSTLIADAPKRKRGSLQQLPWELRGADVAPYVRADVAASRTDAAVQALKKHLASKFEARLNNDCAAEAHKRSYNDLEALNPSNVTVWHTFLTESECQHVRYSWATPRQALDVHCPQYAVW